MSTLFPIQKGSKTILAWTVLIFIAFIFVAFIFVLSIWRLGCNNNSFLKYSDKDYYTPTGFTNKVNAILENALKDHRNVNYTVDSINFYYNRLKFSYSYDSSDILGTIEFRLDTFICANNSESEFYYNSYFKNAIEAQRLHPEREYFHIKHETKYPYKIDSITIDPSLYKLSLTNESWQGNINYNEPFHQIDTNVIFLVFQKNFLPLFASNIYNPGDSRYILSYNDNIFSRNEGHGDTFSVKQNLLELYQKLSRDKLALRVYFDARILQSSPNITIKNQTHSCALQFDNIDSGYIYYKNGSRKQILNNIRRDTIDISKADLPVEIEFKHNNKPINFIISDRSPMSIASAPGNSINSQLRVHPDDDYTDWFCKQFIDILDNGIPTKTTLQNINLSLNPLLSKYLQDEMKKYIEHIKAIHAIRNNSNQSDIFQMSMCLIDNRSGEIIAAPNYSTQFDTSSINAILNTKNFNLTKHFIGSTFKPLLANAASIKYPSLDTFRLSVNDENTYLNPEINECKILGYPIKPFTSGLGYSKATNTKEKLFWDNRYKNISREDFLRFSHDLYPIELGMLALTEHSDPAYRTVSNINIDFESLKNLYGLNGNNHNGKLKVINNETYIDDMKNSSLFFLMSKIYNVYRNNTYDSEFVNWKYHYDTTLLPTKFKLNYAETILPEAVSLNADLLGTDDSSNHFTDFSAWVLGQGRNQWNNLKLAEAYARLFTKRNIHINYWHDSSDNFMFPLNDNTDSLFDVTYQISNPRNIIDASWTKFLGQFRNAQFNSPLLSQPTDSLRNAIRLLQNNLGINADRLIIIGKTGTPSNYPMKRKYIRKNADSIIIYDEGLYSFSIMDSTDYNNTNAASGITGVIFIRHISTNKKLLNPGTEAYGIYSPYARDFLNARRLENIILMNKRRLKIN